MTIIFQLLNTKVEIFFPSIPLSPPTTVSPGATFKFYLLGEIKRMISAT